MNALFFTGILAGRVNAKDQKNWEKRFVVEKSWANEKFQCKLPKHIVLNLPFFLLMQSEFIDLQAGLTEAAAGAACTK